MFIPIGLAMHLAHNAAHLLAEAAGVFPALQRTLNRYTPLDFGAPNWQVAGASSEAIQWLQMALIIIGLCVSLAAYERLSTREHGQDSRAFVPFAVVALFFTVTNLILLTQPMTMRHGM